MSPRVRSSAVAYSSSSSTVDTYPLNPLLRLSCHRQRTRPGELRRPRDVPGRRQRLHVLLHVDVTRIVRLAGTGAFWLADERNVGTADERAQHRGWPGRADEILPEIGRAHV